MRKIGNVTDMDKLFLFVAMVQEKWNRNFNYCSFYRYVSFNKGRFGKTGKELTNGIECNLIIIE